MAARHFAELRAALERHRVDADKAIAEALHWLDLAEQASAIDARVVQAGYKALRATLPHREAVLQLALKYERSTKRIEQLLRVADELAEIAARSEK